GVVADALPAGEERAGWAERRYQRCERYDDHEQADEAHLRIARPQQREPGAAHEKRNAHEQKQRFEQTSPDDSERQLERHALPAALEVHGIAGAPVDVAELRRADDGGARVAIQREQPIPDVNLSGGGTAGLDLRHEPAVTGDAERPSGIFDLSVVRHDGVDGEREVRGVDGAEQDDEPDERRAPWGGHES